MHHKRFKWKYIVHNNNDITNNKLIDLESDVILNLEIVSQRIETYDRYRNDQWVAK